MKKIKVLQIITRAVTGGAFKILSSFTINLDRDRYQIYIVSGEYSNMDEDVLTEMKKNGIILKLNKSLVRDINPIKDISTIISLYHFIKKEKFQIVHTHTSKAGAVGRIAARLANVPVIIHTPHGHIFEPESQIKGVSDSSLRLGTFLLIERILSRFTDKIITLSNAERCRMIELNIASQDKLVSIYNGIEPDKFLNAKVDILKKKQELSLPLDSPIVGYIGRLDPVKGLKYLIDAAVRVVEILPQSKFIIVGDGILKNDLKIQVDRLGVSFYFLFLGLRSDIVELFSIMDVFVLPSLYEGLGIAILEAMAMARPVVATNVGGIPEVVVNNETGILVPPADSFSLAEAMVKLLKDRYLAQLMGHRGRERVITYFDLKKMIEKIDKLYEDSLVTKYTKYGR